MRVHVLARRARRLAPGARYGSGRGSWASTVCKAQLERLKAGLAAVQGGASINNRKTQELNLRVVSQTAS